MDEFNVLRYSFIWRMGDHDNLAGSTAMYTLQTMEAVELNVNKDVMELYQDGNTIPTHVVVYGVYRNEPISMVKKIIFVPATCKVE